MGFRDLGGGGGVEGGGRFLEPSKTLNFYKFSLTDIRISGLRVSCGSGFLLVITFLGAFIV